MPQVSDMAYVSRRFEQFVALLRETMVKLAYPTEKIDKDVGLLEKRLSERDYRLKDERPICHLHSGKRVTRFFLRLAVKHAPAQRAKVARLENEYRLKCAKIRETQPFAVFFSFESAYAGKLAVNYAPFLPRWAAAPNHVTF